MYDIQITLDLINSILSDKNISVNKMLAECSLNKDVVRHMKDGRMPSVDKILIIAEYLDVSVDYLLGRTDNKNSHKL